MGVIPSGNVEFRMRLVLIVDVEGSGSGEGSRWLWLCVAVALAAGAVHLVVMVTQLNKQHWRYLVGAPSARCFRLRDFLILFRDFKGYEG